MSDSGFQVSGDSILYSSLWFTADDTPGEPVLLLLRDDGVRAVMTLDCFRDTAQQIHDGDLDTEDAYRELYVILPGGNSLLPCTMGFAATEDRPKLLIQGTAAISGVLWACDL